MFAFYSQETTELLGHAEAYLPCYKQDEGDDHLPHVHLPERLMIGGPYFCGGCPEEPTYTLEIREEKKIL